MNLVSQRLVALFVAGWLLLSFPLLALWSHDLRLWGLPPLVLSGLPAGPLTDRSSRASMTP